MSRIGFNSFNDKEGRIEHSTAEILQIMAARRQRISTEDRERVITADARQLGIKRRATDSIIRRSMEAQRPKLLWWKKQCEAGQRHEKTLRDVVEEHPAFAVDQIKHESRGRLLILKKLEDAPAE